MSQQIYNWWVASGFSPEEASELTFGKKGAAVDAEKVYHSQPAIAARRQRGKWIKRLQAYGWTNPQIKKAIADHYRKGKGNSPWDFIRENYRSLGIMPIPKYREMAAARARENTRELYRHGKEKAK